MRVRPATIEDCDVLARGLHAVAAEGTLATESDTPVADLEQRLRAAVEWDGHFLLVLEEEGRVVGSIGLRPTSADGVLSLGMWVLPERRGHGGGRMLIEAALAARPAHVHKIELEVFPDNAAAIALYRANGFEEEGLRRDHYRRMDGSLHSALIMARLFGAPA
jgi:[ribosomal protein S18]-alanine N-acetyltransferase